MAKRGPTPSLITGSSGKPTMVVTKIQRKCSRCLNKIEGGGKCFEIPKVGSGFSTKKTYCKTCFKEVLKQTRIDLEELDASLEENRNK